LSESAFIDWIDRHGAKTHADGAGHSCRRGPGCASPVAAAAKGARS
jgi:hypothetical protein